MSKDSFAPSTNGKGPIHTTNVELRLAFMTLNGIMETFDDLVMPTGLKIRKMLRNMKGALEDFREEEKVIIEKYAMKEDKTFALKQNGAGEVITYMAINEWEQGEVDERYKTLLELPIEIEICPILSPSDFKDHKGNMKFMDYLGPFFKDEDE